MNEKIELLSERYYPHVVQLRHWLHEHAELSWKEYQTSEQIVRELEDIGVEYEAHYGNETNVAAWIKGTGPGDPGRVIMLRADMDALPVQEPESHEPRSMNPGVMHACGHDGHTANLLGVVRILNDLKDSFAGTIKFCFEAAEENVGGAFDFMDKGFLDDVEAAYGLHLYGGVKEGKVGIRAGGMMSASDVIHLNIHGVSGHSSQPHLAIDPIVIAAQFITDAQAVISRKLPPYEIGVLGLSTIHAGTMFNIIPDTVEMTGSIRCFSEESRALIHKSMEGILDGLTKAYGATYELWYTNEMYAVINDEKLVEGALKSIESVVGREGIDPMKQPWMGSESFAYYAKKAPLCFFTVGIDAGDALPVNHNLHHNQNFCWHDEVLLTALRTLSQVALDHMTRP